MDTIDRGAIKNYNNEVEKVLLSFFEAYYMSDSLKLYSYLDTSFQKAVPLNYFLIHSDYNIDIGRLIKINKIDVYKDKNIAVVELVVNFQNKNREMIITFKSDFGGWKIEGESVFNRLF